MCSRRRVRLGPVLLAVAARTKTLGTQDPGLARSARSGGIVAYDARIFSERFLDRAGSDRDEASEGRPA